ncbi:MAG: hypothetical protein KGS72_04335 [Cyanobacteria bacterium REEB67]|nr:hypothetical protein [Cyanobacteria bacterium REEB67]
MDKWVKPRQMQKDGRMVNSAIPANFRHEPVKDWCSKSEKHRRELYAAALSVLLFLFCLRVLGQILVVFAHVQFLPPPSAWMSGLLPYPFLLAAQILIIAVYGKVCCDFLRGRGLFVALSPSAVRRWDCFGRVYFVATILRYVLQSNFHPGEIWFTGCIPITFHFVLSTFILTAAGFYRGGKNEQAF